uniref:Natterin-3-like n=1 Tax=Amphiprion percula TaxID=161767 RepID=A0A3P8TTW4_AMPPE
MKLLLLLLLTLVALSSAAPHDLDKTSLLNIESSPESAAEASVAQKNSLDSSSIVSDDGTILEWVTWNNSLPNDAVSVYNDDARRTDYICKYKCEAGFYTPSLGLFCNYPKNKKELRGFPFEVLVNKDNFETLEWKDSSNGSPVQNAVRTCPGVEVYVGKNKYGLGKVVTQDNVFYLPWKGGLYSYRSYQVLTINENIVSQQIEKVVYNTDKFEIISYPPEIIRETAITNYECTPVVKTDSLSKTYQVEQRWDNTYSVRFGVTTTFKAGIPFIAKKGIQISTDVTLQFNRGGSVVESITDTVSVELSAPPNRTCTATMMRYKHKLNIPYTARLKRKYGTGEVRTVIITGTYNSVQVGQVQAEVHRCQPVTDAKLCP